MCISTIVHCKCIKEINYSKLIKKKAKKNPDIHPGIYFIN